MQQIHYLFFLFFIYFDSSERYGNNFVNILISFFQPQHITRLNIIINKKTKINFFIENVSNLKKNNIAKPDFIVDELDL